MSTKLYHSLLLLKKSHRTIENERTEQGKYNAIATTTTIKYKRNKLLQSSVTFTKKKKKKKFQLEQDSSRFLGITSYVSN